MKQGQLAPVQLHVRPYGVPFLAVFISGCGGAIAGGSAPSPHAVQSAEAPDYATIDDAERALSRAEREVAMLGPAPQPGAARRESPKTASPPIGGAEASPATPAPAAGPPPPPAPPSADRRSHADDKPADEERASRPATPCETACRALASMGRAADAICRLAGDTDARCSSARRRVEDSASRAASCRCETR